MKLKTLIVIAITTFLMSNAYSYGGNGTGGNQGGGGSGMTASAIFMPMIPFDIADI